MRGLRPAPRPTTTSSSIETMASASPRPPLYSPHWPIVPLAGQSARPMARRGIVRAGQRSRHVPATSWTTANCEALHSRRSSGLTVFSLGKAARGSVFARTPGQRDHCLGDLTKPNPKTVDHRL